MSLYENFPYTNLQELNLGWLVQEVKKMHDSSVISVNGQTGEVVLYESDNMQLPNVDSNVWQIIRVCDDTVCGIHFNKNGNATIVNGNRLIQIYTADNPPPYPVTSVNGQTGDITLYQSSVVKLPDLNNEELQQWNIYRLLNGVQRGIQFQNDGTVKIINGTARETVYTDAHPPAYPVTSVEGMTGNVILFPETEIQFNDVDDASQHIFSLFSKLNAKDIGIKIDDTGRAWILRDEDEIPLYLQGMNDPSDFVDPTAPVLQVFNNLAAGSQWGIVRRVGNDDTGVVVAYDPGEGNYKAYLKINSQLIQLLTLADIPSDTGVVSINGETGVVTLTGGNISIGADDETDIETAVNLALSNIGIVENGDTATHSILAGEFVIWKRHLYKARTNIAVDTALSSVNMESVSGGGLNQFQDVINYSGDITWGAAAVVGSSPVGILHGVGRIRMLRVVFHPTTNSLNTWKTILTLPQQHWPSTYISILSGTTTNYPNEKAVRLTNAGVLEVYGPENDSFSLNIMYIVGDY